MNSSILLIPIIFIRFILMRYINKEALKKASFFPPTIGKEKSALYIYQIGILILIIYLFFIEIVFYNDSIYYIGLIMCFLGALFYGKSVIDFSSYQKNGLNKNGLYKYSRNPMYISFFIYFIGCSFLIRSWIYILILIIFQISVHYLILSEERWCIETFGEEYQIYLKKVRRYI